MRIEVHAVWVVRPVEHLICKDVRSLFGPWNTYGRALQRDDELSLGLLSTLRCFLRLRSLGEREWRWRRLAPSRRERQRTRERTRDECVDAPGAIRPCVRELH